MLKLNDHSDRKHRICNRNRAFAYRNHDPRRPIIDVLEVRLGQYIRMTVEALKDRNESVYRPLLAYSAFHSSGLWPPRAN